MQRVRDIWTEWRAFVDNGEPDGAFPWWDWVKGTEVVCRRCEELYTFGDVGIKAIEFPGEVAYVLFCPFDGCSGGLTDMGEV